ncbi:MAG: T9SS type A sorting domain-containing protein, partial [Bacteroidales bacterium]|nr:T9SS type A sorting domain-containing protein [Bacteroidales bacterium]
SVTVSAEANNSGATVNITQPLNIHGTPESRTSAVEITAKDGTTTKTYTIIFSVSEYLFAEGFSKFGSNVVPYDNWEVEQTYTHDHAGPNSDHAEFPGIGAFKFVRGQEDKQGFLKFKYKGCGVLSFYLFVEEPDGNEVLKVETKVGFGLPQTVGNYTADSMSTDWKKFVIEINEADSVLFTFWPTMTADGSTRIWMDDISLTGFGFTPPSTGIFNLAKQNSLLCYPNPATDILNVDLGDINRGIIIFHNVVGAKIREIPLLNPRTTIDISQLNAGIYFISLKGNRTVQPTKLIVK